MKRGDLVKLKIDHDTFFDWKLHISNISGYWLREPKTLNLIKERRGEVTTQDTCLIVDIDRQTLALVLTPRQQLGLIHINKLEVISEAG